MKLLLLPFMLFFIQVAAQSTHPEGPRLKDTTRLSDTARLKDTVKLKEAIVRGVRSPVQQTPEGLVVNVENSLLSKGSTALEVLERSPGIIIDHRNNTISLNGKDGVMVMLNGRLMRMPISEVMTLLQGMSADDIEKIELLTTPSSKYDAEGSAGLINIVLKKSRRRGDNGNLSLTGGYGWGEKGTAALSLAHNRQDIDVYGTYNFSHDRTYSNTYITSSSQEFPILGGPLQVLFLDTTRRIQNNHNVTAGLEARINPRTTLGASLIYSSSSAATDAVNNAGYNVLPDSLLSFEGHINGNDHWHNLVSSAWLERKIREEEKISFDADYLRYNNNDPTAIQSTFTNKHGARAGSNDDSLFSPLQRGSANTTIKVGVIKIDYEKRLNKKMRLESGVKGTYTRTSSISGLESMVNGAWVQRTEASNDILMKEGIGAAYATVHTELRPSTTLSIGFRYEYVQTRMDDRRTGKTTLSRQQGALFPSLFFSKKLTDLSELQLSFTRRITRPTYNDLASFVGYVDPVAVFTGNSLLQPTITSNLKLGYNWSNYTFSLLLSRDDHPIAEAQLTQSPANDLLYVSPQNMRYRNSLTLQATLPWKINDWWNMNYSLVGGWRRFGEDYTPQPVEKTYFGYSLTFNQTFLLPKNFSAELSGWYNSLSYQGTIKEENLWSLNAGVKKELKNNGGILQLSVSDLLRSMQVRINFGTLTREAYGTTNHVIINTESRTFPIVKLTWSKPFGSGIKSTEKQRQGSGDEMERIRKN